MMTDRLAREDSAEHCEIEITPEMIAAGAAVIAELKEGMDSYSLAAEVYRTMAAAAQPPK